MNSGKRRNTSSSTIGRNPPSITDRMCFAEVVATAVATSTGSSAVGSTAFWSLPGTVKTVPTARASISWPSIPSRAPR